MSKIRAFIVGGDHNVLKLLESDPLFEVVNGGRMPPLDAFDMVVFTGGEDISPEFYGEENKFCSTWMNHRRDLVELNIFRHTKDTHYHFGICRGMQLLAIAHGHKLWQDISGHQSGRGHNMTLTRGHNAGAVIEGVTSVHHQAIYETALNAHTIMAHEAYDQPVTARSGDGKSYTLNAVPEAAWFEETRSFGVQGHPEYSIASKAYKDYVLYHLIEDIDTGYYANTRKGRA